MFNNENISTKKTNLIYPTNYRGISEQQYCC